MEQSEPKKTSPSERSRVEESPTKGRGAPQTKGRGEGKPAAPKPVTTPRRSTKELIDGAIRELQGGSRPGVGRAKIMLEEARQQL